MQPQAITSRRSTRVLQVRRLHDAKGRRESGRILVEGPDALACALAAGAAAIEVFATERGLERAGGLVTQARQAGATVHSVTEEVMSALAQTQAPQGIVATCAWRPAPLAATIRSGASCLVLEAVADPGNAGTIIRTADAAGLSGVVLTEGSVDPGNGKCIRASTGSLFHLPVCSAAEPQEVLEQARSAGLQVAVVTLQARLGLFEWVRERRRDRAVCWVLGNEARGVGELMHRSADVRLRIPMSGRAESLNVASAAAVCLYADLAAGMED